MPNARSNGLLKVFRLYGCGSAKDFHLISFILWLYFWQKVLSIFHIVNWFLVLDYCFMPSIRSFNFVFTKYPLTFSALLRVSGFALTLRKIRFLDFLPAQHWHSLRYRFCSFCVSLTGLTPFSRVVRPKIRLRLLAFTRSSTSFQIFILKIFHFVVLVHMAVRSLRSTPQPLKIRFLDYWRSQGQVLHFKFLF